MQYVPWSSRSDAADVSAGIIADGVVFELPSRARKESAAARPGVQHALSAAHRVESRGGRWAELYRSNRFRSRAGEEVQRAQRKGHYELQHMSSVRTAS